MLFDWFVFLLKSHRYMECVVYKEQVQVFVRSISIGMLKLILVSVLFCSCWNHIRKNLKEFLCQSCDAMVYVRLVFNCLFNISTIIYSEIPKAKRFCQRTLINFSLFSHSDKWHSRTQRYCSWYNYTRCALRAVHENGSWHWQGIIIDPGTKRLFKYRGWSCHNAKWVLIL